MISHLGKMISFYPDDMVIEGTMASVGMLLIDSPEKNIWLSAGRVEVNLWPRMGGLEGFISFINFLLGSKIIKTIIGSSISHSYGSGHKGVAVLLHGFAISW